MNNLRKNLGGSSKKGFTLIELLIVIAILAVLATTVTLVLNPAELLRQGRDSTRLSDLSTLNGAVSLYLADVSSPSFDGDLNCTVASTSPFASGSCTTVTSTAVDGNGWVDVNFGSISSGSPLARLPLDPTNSGDYFYAFKTNSTDLTFEINANMESTRYENGGGDDVESDDGGDNDDWYEVGSALDL